MDSTNRIKDVMIGPLEGRKPECLVILLHGANATGSDIIGMAEVLAKKMPRARYIAPTAVHSYMDTPTGRQWFELQGQPMEAIIQGLQQAAPPLEDYLQQVVAEHGLGFEDVVIAGFSQGAMLALYTALRLSTPVAGVVCFSGMLLPADGVDEITARPPVCFLHGADDTVIPADRIKQAITTLMAANVRSEYHICKGLGHAINPESVHYATKFMTRALPCRRP
ncbi:MAG: dienelactone hydrolase family protein [Rhodospirillaceae bacterium]|nr:dienelactone hydrolase family protein [Rhodospirillaceae bacterium]